MQGLKKEFPPLLPPGFHEIPLEEYDDKFVLPFNSPDRRKFLLDRYREFIEILKSFGVSIELWIDGSFLTEKIDPDDIDIVCFLPVNVLSTEAKNTLSMLRKESKVRFSCHFFIAPLGDQKAASGWEKDYGFSRRKEPKGIAVIKVNSHE